MKVSVTILCFFLALGVQAQQKPTDLDKSPMDMSYWPNNYPLLKMSGKVKDMPVARVIYGRPLKNGRTISVVSLSTMNSGGWAPMKPPKSNFLPT